MPRVALRWCLKPSYPAASLKAVHGVDVIYISITLKDLHGQQKKIIGRVAYYTIAGLPAYL